MDVLMCISITHTGKRRPVHWKSYCLIMSVRMLLSKRTSIEIFIVSRIGYIFSSCSKTLHVLICMGRNENLIEMLPVMLYRRIPCPQ